jgi:hypothetical protein
MAINDLNGASGAFDPFRFTQNNYSRTLAQLGPASCEPIIPSWGRPGEIACQNQL